MGIDTKRPAKEGKMINRDEGYTTILITVARYEKKLLYDLEEEFDRPISRVISLLVKLYKDDLSLVLSSDSKCAKLFVENDDLNNAPSNCLSVNQDLRKDLFVVRREKTG